MKLSCCCGAAIEVDLVNDPPNDDLDGTIHASALRRFETRHQGCRPPSVIDLVPRAPEGNPYEPPSPSPTAFGSGSSVPPDVGGSG